MHLSGGASGENIVYKFSDPPDCPVEDFMEFHLTYNGELLKACTNGNRRVWEKHQIRREIHKQLVTLWGTHPLLKFYSQDHHVEGPSHGMYFVAHALTSPEQIAKRHEGYVPLVSEEFGTFCDLNILFLRAEPVGQIIKRNAGGGDIDNRLKTLLDALCIPQRGAVPEPRQQDDPDPSPMFVLLSDDSLVTSLNVRADRLLTTSTDDPAEACVVIQVNVKVVDSLRAPYGIAL